MQRVINPIIAFLLLLFVLLGVGCQENKSVVRIPIEKQPLNEAWGFEGLLRDIQMASTPARKMAMVDSFFATRGAEGFPIIEDSVCYFVVRGNVSGSVVGDFNQWKPGVDSLIPVESTDLFYAKKVFPLDARLDYKFVLGNQWLLDPLNPRLIYGGFGPNSELVMPHYVYPREIDYQPDIPHGRLEEFTFHSQILNNSRKIIVYLPPDYSRNNPQRYPTLYVQDGREYLQLANIANVLDNLIAAKEIQPLIAVFINPTDRNKEYWLNDQYIAMVTTEIIPMIDSTYHTRATAEGRGIMGASLGGAISLYAGVKAPGYFRYIAGQSSAIWIENQKIVTLFREGNLPALTVYLDWGTFEPGMEEVHQQLIQILKNNGHRVTYAVFPEGHSWGNWRAHIDNILKTFWGTQ